MIESETWRCARWATAGEIIRGKRSDLACDEVFFGADAAGSESLSDQEAIGRDTQTGVMVEPAPAAPFVVTEPQFLLEFLIVALDAPAPVRLSYQVVQGDVFGKGRQIVFERFGIASGPLDQ